MSNGLQQKSEVLTSANKQKTQSKAQLQEERTKIFKTEYSTQDHSISLKDFEQKYEHLEFSLNSYKLFYY